MRVLLFALAAALYAVFVARTALTWKGELVGTLFDDALISLRYAHNLAAGHGLVWNPGEQRPVEGYTNPLWTLLLSLLFAVMPVLKAPLAASALGAVILLASGWVAGRLVERAGGDRTASLAASFLVLSCYPAVFWTLRGMEVGLVALFGLLAASLVVEPPERPQRTLVRLALLAGLAFLTRPDSVLLFVPMFLLLKAWRWPLALLPLAVCIAGQFLFRWHYYGELMPNTYVLKMTGTPSVGRLAAGLEALLYAAPALLVAGATVAFGKRTRLAFVCLGVAALQSAYLVWIGGDAWTHDNSNRFIATILPLLLAGTVVSLSQRRSLAWAAVLVIGGAGLVLSGDFPLGPRSNLLAAAGLALLLVPTRRLWIPTLALFLIVSGPAWTRWALLNAADVASDIAYSRTGLAFRDTLPAGTSIATAWLGAPSYYSGFATIDLLGKTDKAVARLAPAGRFRPGHNKMDLGHSIGSLQPDVVMLHAPGVDVPPIDQPAIGPMGYTYLGYGLWFRTAYLEKLKDRGDLRCLSPTPPDGCR